MTTAGDGMDPAVNILHQMCYTPIIFLYQLCPITGRFADEV
jgi:hypothetical protein